MYTHAHVYMRVHGDCIHVLKTISPPQPSPPTCIHSLDIRDLCDHYKPNKSQDHAGLKPALSCVSMSLCPVFIQPLVGCVFVTGQQR